MKTLIVEAIKGIDRLNKLTDDEREQIACAAVKIFEDSLKKKADVALEAVKNGVDH